MKRIIGVLACILLLCGCAAENTDTRTEDLQAKYAAMAGCEATVDVWSAGRDETAHYRLKLEKSGDESRVTVLEPEELAGVSAVVSGDALSLAYDGAVLSAGAAPGLCAVNAADMALRAAATGYVTERSRERYDDTDALRLCFETELCGETLYVTIYFDASDAPLYAEIERDGEILQYLEFTDFIFGDIVEPIQNEKGRTDDGNAPQTNLGGDRP